MLEIHGGSWIAGHKDISKSDKKYYCNKNDVAIAGINYSYVSESVHMDTLINEITMALTKIKELAASKNININNVLLTGKSAGGHLSLLYAYKCKDISPIPVSCVVSYCGPTDLTDKNFFYNTDGSRKEWAIELAGKVTGIDITNMAEDFASAQDELKKYSPLTYVDESAVPTVIGHGEKDTVVPFTNAISLDEALTRANVDHIFIRYPNSEHSLQEDPESAEAMDKWLDYCVKTYLN